MALDALEGEDLSESVKCCQTQLEEAEKALRGLELRMSRMRSKSHALFEVDPDMSADTRAWLLKTFTDQDSEAAAGNIQLREAMSSMTWSSASSGERARLSAIDLGEVQRALSEDSITQILEGCARPDFDAFALEAHPEAKNHMNTVFASFLLKAKTRLASGLSEDNGWTTSGSAFLQAYITFMTKIDGLYATGALYHSATHAVDCTATTHWLMQSEHIMERTTCLDHFIAVAAAAVHDVGHPGTNNLFHTKTMSDLAIRYNDRSVLENMHIALAFETMKDPDCDWFSLLSRSPAGEGEGASLQVAHLQQYVRKGLIATVLATDMAKHSGQVSELTSVTQEAELANSSGESSPSGLRVGNVLSDDGDRQKALERKMFLLETVLHAADISNPSKPKPIMLGWTLRVLSEFWAQGDKERQLGLEVSPLCDRETGMASVPKGQVGFINFVALPFFTPLASLVSEVQQAREVMLANSEFWKEQDAAQKTFEEIFGPDGVAAQVGAAPVPDTA